MTQRKKKTARPRPTRAKRSRPRAKRKRPTARTADKHALYQASVQNAEVEVDFVDKTFRSLRGRLPHSLLEDFCGTALVCREWIGRGAKRTATGVDIDRRVLGWGKTAAKEELGEDADRLTFLRRDVRAPIPGRYDAALALNFSYWIFKTRSEMRGYFANVRKHLGKDGVFFLDAYGGSEAHEQMTERRRITGGFTYVWDQSSVDPITNDIVNHIHFEFRDGTKMKKAFTYRWRFWSLPELRELLEEAGFSKVMVYWDHAKKDGDDEIFRPTLHAQTQYGWIVYIVALR